ncbi:MAG: cysteine desulfurase family protein [Kosmotogaceae bacterium]
MIYLDNNATTKVDPDVLSEMNNFHSKTYGNPNAVHHMGVEAENAMKSSREKVAEILKAKPEEIYFTSSATESINWVLRSSVFHRKRRNKVVTSSIEHKAVLDTLRDLKNIYNIKIVVVNPDRNGIVSAKKMINEIDEDTFLVSLMAVNNITGAIQPYEELGKYLINKNIFFHIDAVQTVGKIDFDVEKAQCDFASFSGHKFHGPKGTGILYARKGVPNRPLITGGGQERGMRSGTQNVPGIAGIALAMQRSYEYLDDVGQRLSDYKIKIVETIRSMGGVINSSPDKTIINTVSASFPGIKGEVIVNALSEKGVYVGISSACSTLGGEGDYVLKAMNLDSETIFGSFRISMSRYTTDEEIDKFIEILRNVVSFLNF